MNILIVEDEFAIAQRIEQQFLRKGFITQCVTTCQAALDHALIDDFDCIILDRRLPDADGLEVCKQLRENGNTTPILILSALSFLDQRVEGLEYGADDYLIKPFAMSELLARVQALIRRNSSQKNPGIKIRNITLDTRSRSVSVGGNEISLSNKEYCLLEYLMRNAGRVLDKIQIQEHVWGDVMGDSNIVEVYINYLRKKIATDATESPIKTVRGYGYKFQK